jgi:raffinose/stachyose/melibiose transport system permease protein
VCSSDLKNAMLPVLVVMLWMYTGFYVIIFLANLQKIDVSIIEASKIDGASEMQTLRYIIFPALSGVIVTAAILAISGSLRSFDLIYVMTQGGPAHRTSVLALYMYEKAFKGAPNYPVANAISTIMVLISFALIIITRLVEKRFSIKE